MKHGKEPCSFDICYFQINFVTTTNTQFNSGRKTIYSGKYCRQNRPRENTDRLLAFAAKALHGH